MNPLSNYERETIINFNEGEDTASIYTHNRWLYPPRQISDEQRAAIAERLNAANPRRKTTCVQGVQEHEAAGEGNYTTQQSDGAEL